MTLIVSPKNLLFIVYKDTSEMDYVLPLIWKIRSTMPELKVSVLYGALSKRKFIGDGRFYSEILNKVGVTEYELGDFLKPLPQRIINYISSPVQTANTTNTLLLKAKTLLRKICEKIALALLSYKKIFNYFNPDIIFIAARGYHNQFKNEIIHYVINHNKQIVLHPQGPFPGNGVMELCRKNEENILLTGKIKVWLAFHKENTSKEYSGVNHLTKDKFQKVGYPGLDNEWLNFIKSKFHKKNHNDSHDQPTITCTILIRKFEQDSHDVWGVMNREEFMTIMKKIAQFINTTKEINVKTIIKPHPLNNREEVKKICLEAGFTECEVTSDTLWEIITYSNFVISFPSTSFIVPAISGIPTILLNTSFTKKLMEWQPINEMISGMHYYLDDPQQQLQEAIKDVLFNTSNEKIQKDIEHLRKFYPDGALNECIKDLNSICTSI